MHGVSDDLDKQLHEIITLITSLTNACQEDKFVFEFRI